ncbi:MAG: ammonium transporter [Alphaproteobacteria bacterium]|nr:ammonium transporter [Alphaproteobacteria bacterium]
MNGADTAWILTSTALVLFMTLPGLALFYGGLVRSSSVLSVLMQCFSIACTVSVLWLVCAYSIAFAEGTNWWGGLDKAFLDGAGTEALSGALPETVFFAFQMTFAIITPALIVGAYVERIRFGFVILFTLAWVLVVYAPVAHWVWGGGFLADWGVRDFAGGIVVHVTAGVSALVLAIMLGGRHGFPREVRPPHSPGMTMTGAAMLWVGWFGFNAGSALAANGNAGMAMVVTHTAAACGAIAWSAIEYIRFGKSSLIGAVTGMVAGLATITPASGFVGPLGGLALGIAGGVICYFATALVKQAFKIDDSLDVFAVHGVGGALGTLLTAIFASPRLGGLGQAADMTWSSQLVVQVEGVVIVALWAAVVTFVLAKLIGLAIPMRVTSEIEVEGPDLAAHGERAYDL